MQAGGFTMVFSMPYMNVVALVIVNVLGVSSKYINDIHGNTVVQDHSTGFHVFELHGFSVGVTSSIFVGAALTICATYLAFRLGLGKLLLCCCKCTHCYEGQGQQAMANPQPVQQQVVQQPLQPVPQAMHMVQQQIPVQQPQATTSMQPRTNSDANLGPFTVKIVR